MTATLEVETDDFARAANTMYSGVGEPVQGALTLLPNGLQDSGGMAGTDPGGAAWGRAYDDAAQRALHAGQDVINGAYRLSAMFAQSARNYGDAESASAPRTRGHVGVVVADLPPTQPVVRVPTALPPAAGAAPVAVGALGGSVIGPVVSLIQLLVPDGHQDRLHDAAGVWRTAAAALADAADSARWSTIQFAAEGLPEAGDMVTVAGGMYGHLGDLAGVFRSIAQACEDYAHHLDVAHSTIEHELADLAEQTVAIEAGGALLSVFTLGGSVAAAQAAVAARVAVAVNRIRDVIETFTAAVRAVAAAVGSALAAADRIAAQLVGLLDVRLTYAVVASVRTAPGVVRSRELLAMLRLARIAEDLPLISFQLTQLERKFKHAYELGVLGKRGREGFEQFKAVLAEFLSRPGVVRIGAKVGRYRKDPAILTYEPRSGLVVVQKPDGEFITAFRMNAAQLRSVRLYGSLGGG